MGSGGLGVSEEMCTKTYTYTCQVRITIKMKKRTDFPIAFRVEEPEGFA